VVFITTGNISFGNNPEEDLSTSVTTNPQKEAILVTNLQNKSIYSI